MATLTLGAAPDYLNVVLVKGAGWTVTLNVKTSAGAAQDMTGIDARLTVNTIVLTSVGNAGGTYAFTLSQAQVDALPVSSAARLDLVDVDGLRPWAIGKATVVDD